MHGSRLTAKGQRPIGFAVEGLRQAHLIFPSAESGFDTEYETPTGESDLGENTP